MDLMAPTYTYVRLFRLLSMTQSPHKKKAGLTIEKLIRSVADLVNDVPGQRYGGPEYREPNDLPPWQSWKLDEDFLVLLSQWTREHPENTLDHALEKIREGLENSKELVELIPSGPLPVRELVAALGYLLKFGVDVSLAKNDIQDFLKEVIELVDVVLQGFRSQGNGYFAGQAWQRLKNMRDVVDEICSWAAARLEDDKIPWWSRMKHRLSTDKDIQEFKQRIKDAKERFRDLALIAQAEGFDRITQASQRQEAMLTESKSYQDLQTKKLEAEERNYFFAQTLDMHTVPNPTYDKHDKHPCDEGTRTGILEKIRNWVNDTAPGSRNFLWLTGVPGSGKSAVAASVARECKDRKILWAQYFITRTDTATTNPKKYFPSIARQIADCSPDVANAIRDALKETPSLTDDISANQVAALFINSICKASELDPSRPVVVILDGLDETDHDRLDETAELLSSLFSHFKHHNNVKVFISSRTEDEIHRSFSPQSNNDYVEHVDLDIGDPTSIRDVSNYIQRNLSSIFKKHKLDWDKWSGGERSKVLGRKASGLFIWGVTAIKFLQERIRASGKEGLNDTFKILAVDIPPGINALYTHILDATLGEDLWELERLRRIVGTILFWKKPLCIDDVALLLDLRRELPMGDPVDVVHIMSLFRTILVVGTDEVDGETIPRTHKSVFEFFTSPTVDAKYRVEPRQAHLEIGIQCLVHIGAAHTLASCSPLPELFQYACSFWSSHLSQADILGSRLICADYRHFPASPLPSFLKPLGSLEQPIKISASKRGRIEISMGTCKQVSYTRTPLWQRTRMVLTGLMFSNDATQVVSCLDNNGIAVHDVLHSPWAHTIIQGPSSSLCLALSLNGKTIASGLRNGSIQLWDSVSGTPVGIPLASRNESGSGYAVRCIDFSPDGEQVVAGFGKRCILWNLATRQPIGSPWSGHKNDVLSIVFSNSGLRVCSVDRDGKYLIWDARTGVQISSGTYRRFIRRVSFSPKNDDILALGGSGGILIIFGDSKWVDDKVGWIRGLRFAPDGKTIIFCNQKTIFIAIVEGGKASANVIRKADYNPVQHDDRFLIAFSPNLDYFAYSDWNKLQVYSLHQNETSLDIIPVQGSIPPGTLTDNQVLVCALSNLKEVQCKPETVIKNRRLDNIKWYQERDNVVQSFGKVLVVTDHVIVAVDEDELVSVWKLDK